VQSALLAEVTIWAYPDTPRSDVPYVKLELHGDFREQGEFQLSLLEKELSFGGFMIRHHPAFSFWLACDELIRGLVLRCCRRLDIVRNGVFGAARVLSSLELERSLAAKGVCRGRFLASKEYFSGTSISSQHSNTHKLRTQLRRDGPR
jgi:hypothetical protein